MKISEFNRLVAKYEGKKKQVNITQISEISSVMNRITDGEFYKLIHQLKKDSFNNKKNNNNNKKGDD